MEAIWQETKLAIKSLVPGHSYKMWIDPLELSSCKSGVVVLSCPNFFYKKRIKDNYSSIIEKELKKALGNDCRLMLEISPKGKSSKKQKRFNKKTSPSTAHKQEDTFKHTRQPGLPNMDRPQYVGRLLRKDFTFDNFVVGENNDYAYRLAHSLASNRRSDQNSMFLLSKTGMGKTHLSQAMGHHIMSKYPSDNVYYVTAEDFANEMIYSFKSKSIDKFKKKYRKNCDVLLIEDIHFLSGKEHTQNELSFALDYMLEAKKKIIFTSCYLPADIPKMSDQLRSRLSSGLISNIDPPNFRTRVRILKKKSKENGYAIPGEIVDYLAGELSDNVRQLESGLVGIAAKSSLTGSPINLGLAESVVKNIVSQSKNITVDAIKNLVCQQYKVSKNDIASRSRRQSVVFPRQIAIYLARLYTDQPLQTIGKYFNRYHATIMHSISKVEKRIKENGATKKQVDYLCKKLEAGKY
jgi:chromosomal replication initiator protein